jgi:hypothetical protein
MQFADSCAIPVSILLNKNVFCGFFTVFNQKDPATLRAVYPATQVAAAQGAG